MITPYTHWCYCCLYFVCKVLNGVNHIEVNVRVCCACMCELAAIGYFYTWLAHLIAWNDSRSWNVIKRGLAEKAPLLTPTDTFTVSGRNEAYPELLCLLIFNFEWSKHLRERKKRRKCATHSCSKSGFLCIRNSLSPHFKFIRSNFWH